MNTIRWRESPEGSSFWQQHYHTEFISSSNRVPPENEQLANFLIDKYGDPSQDARSETSQANYRRALKLILKFQERFDALPSSELLESLL